MQDRLIAICNGFQGLGIVPGAQVLSYKGPYLGIQKTGNRSPKKGLGFRG